MNDQDIIRRLRQALDEVAAGPADVDPIPSVRDETGWFNARRLGLVAACLALFAGGVWAAARAADSDSPRQTPVQSPSTSDEPEPPATAQSPTTAPPSVATPRTSTPSVTTAPAPGETGPASERMQTTPPAAPTTGAPTPTTSGTLPEEIAELREPTEAELRVTEALGELGLEAHRGEHPNPIGVGSANMYVSLPDGSELFALAHAVDAYSGDSEVTSEREVNGLTVQEVQYINGPTGDAFVCDEIRYEIRGAPPPDYDNIDDFLTDYIQALGCA